MLWCHPQVNVAALLGGGSNLPRLPGENLPRLPGDNLPRLPGDTACQTLLLRLQTRVPLVSALTLGCAAAGFLSCRSALERRVEAFPSEGATAGRVCVCVSCVCGQGSAKTAG